MFQVIRSKFSNGYTRVSVVFGTLAAPVLAFAQETDPFAAQLATVTTKVTTYGGGLLVLAGVGVVFMVGIKYLKKIRGAA